MGVKDFSEFHTSVYAAVAAGTELAIRREVQVGAGSSEK